MKIYEEKPLKEFDFWSGAADRVCDLTAEQLDDIELQLEELYPDGIEDTALNDLFWFEFPWVLSLIGLTDEDGVKEWWNSLDDDDKQEYADLEPNDFIREDTLQAAEEWWDGLSDEEKHERAEIVVDGSMTFDDITTQADKWWCFLTDSDKVELYGDVTEDDGQKYLDLAFDDCTEAADDWWDDLDFSERLACYKENK